VIECTETLSTGVLEVYITAGVFSAVCCLFFAAVFWSRAGEANQPRWKWGLGALVVYEVAICVLFVIEYLIASPFGVPVYPQAALALVIWFVFTWYSASVSTSIMAKYLPVPAGT
jgi:hypothetical protein